MDADLVVVRHGLAWRRDRCAPRAGRRASTWALFRRVHEIDGFTVFIVAGRACGARCGQSRKI